MAPPPARNRGQSQKFTTALRTICESYPSNTCLRELLQNADDAEATEIEYVLDTTFYDGPLLHNELLDCESGTHGICFKPQICPKRDILT